jgi:hypothetical protein
MPEGTREKRNDKEGIISKYIAFVYENVIRKFTESC